MRPLLALALLASPAMARDAGQLRLYPTHGSPERLLIQGRFLELEGVGLLPERARDHRVTNLVRNLRELDSDEIEGATIQVEVAGQQFSAVTDDDGVFQIDAALVGVRLPPGPIQVVARALEDRGHPTPPVQGTVFVLPSTPAVAVLSDYDDTVAISQIPSKRGLLKNALLKNSHQTTPVPGGPEAYRRAVAAGAVAVFYVSGSPQNFMPRIQEFLAFREYPAGPIELKNFGSDPTFDQTTFKLGRLQAILDAHPQVRFVLVGDSGERDPEIYHQLRGRQPDRIAGIVIRLVPGGDNRPERFTGTIAVTDFAADPDVLARLVAPPK